MSQRPLGETSGSTLATRIFAEIQARIISGAFRPGQKLRVRGTPALFFADGERVSGAVPAAQVEELLAKAAAKK